MLTHGHKSAVAMDMMFGINDGKVCVGVDIVTSSVT